MWRILTATTVIATLATLTLSRPAQASGYNQPFYGDLTGDGRADRITLGFQRPNRCVVIVEENRPGGYGAREIHTYPSPAQPSDSDWCPHLAVAVDLGWDGTTEIVVSWFNGRPPGVNYGMLVLRNFQPSAGFDALPYPSFMELADFNGDGHDDIYQLGDEGNGFRTYLNTAAGGLVPGTMQWCSGLPQEVIADFDGNGAMGALLAYEHECGNDASGVVIIRDNGVPTQLQRDPTGDTTWRAEVIDANADDLPDVRTVDLDTGAVDVFINLDDLEFTRAPVANDDRITIPNSRRTGIPILANDIASRDAKITIVRQPRHGTVQITTAGLIVYDPSPGHGSRDDFSYRLTQNGRSDVASVSIRFTDSIPTAS